MTSQSQYERVDGELQHDGVYYNYVERKVSNDTLYLKCRVNSKKTSLYRNLTEYAGRINDIPGEKNANQSARKLVLANEYIQHLTTYKIPAPVISSTEYKIGANKSLPDSYVEDLFKPPKATV